MLAGWSSGEVCDLLGALCEAGALEQRYTTRTINGRQVTYREVALNDRSWALMRRQLEDFTMVFPHAGRVARPMARTASSTSDLPGGLMAMLRDVRRQTADRFDVPPYVVAPNKTLEDMARLRPTTCLLYTSPSPRDQRGSRMPSSA